MVGDKEESVYSEGFRENLIDSDSISPEEQGFMKGYNEDDKEERKCFHCGDKFKEEAGTLREIEGEEYHFCCDECADEFEKSLESED